MHLQTLFQKILWYQPSKLGHYFEPNGLFMVTDPTYLKEFQTISADFWSSKGILIVISMIFINFLMRFYSLRMDFNDFDQVLC